MNNCTGSMKVDAAQSLLDDIDNGDMPLSMSDAEFIDKLMRKTDDGFPPTYSQAERLRNLHARLKEGK